jgi:hypothetical protein
MTSRNRLTDSRYCDQAQEGKLFPWNFGLYALHAHSQMLIDRFCRFFLLGFQISSWFSPAQFAAGLQQAWFMHAVELLHFICVMYVLCFLLAGLESSTLF